VRKLGKVGKRNLEANRKLKMLFADKGITRCELCQSSFILSWHHRHKRMWYRSCPEMLSDFSQAILVCARHHDMLEKDKNYSQEVFESLRGKEIDKYNI
jgi:hypothetical protein